MLEKNLRVENGCGRLKKQLEAHQLAIYISKFV